MKAKTNLRSILVGTVLCAALVVAVLAVGCFGDGDESTTVTSTASAGATTLTSAVVGTTIVADAGALSSFNSKDPFIAQAQATTTTTPPTTAATTSSTTTTTAPTTTTSSTTTTTAAQVLLVLGVAPDELTTSFQVGSITFYGVMAGSRYVGPWGSLLVLGMHYDLDPTQCSVDFEVDGDEFTLAAGVPRVL